MPFMRQGSPYLYDEATGQVVGIKNPDGTELFFDDIRSPGSASPQSAAPRAFKSARIAVNVPRWLTALSKWENGTLGRDLRVALPSSSINADDLQAGTAAQRTSVANALSNQCRNRGMKADCETFFGTFGGGTVAAVAGFDSRQSFTGATASGSQKTQGGASISMTAAGTWVLTTTKPVTKARIFFRDTTTGRNVTWSATGGASGTISTSGVGQIGEALLDLGASGLKTVTFTWGAGNFDLYGAILYNDTGGQSNVQFIDMTFRGATSASLMDDGGPGGGPGSGNADAGRVRVLAKVAPDVIILDPGIVNDWNGSVLIDTAEARYRTLIGAYQAIADVIVVTPPFSAGANAGAAQQNQYVVRLLQACTDLGVPVIDYRDYEESWAKVDNVPSNTWHPNRDVHLGEAAKGNLARIIRNALGLV